MPIRKIPRVNSNHSCVQSSTVSAHRDDDKITMPNDEEMNRTLKALLWKSDDNNSDKDGIDNGKNDFKDLAQELNKKEGLNELLQQTLANILETVWQNPQSYQKIK